LRIKRKGVINAAAIKYRKKVVVMGSSVVSTPFSAIGRTPHIKAVQAAKNKPNFQRPERRFIRY
jgi:hypothetical protein